MSGIVQNNILRSSGTIAVSAAGLNWDSTILTAFTTFTVTVQNVGGSNYYYINGVRQDTLNLLEGFTYKFDQSDSSNSGHPLRFSTTSNGSHNSGSEYTTGVTTSGTPGNAGAYTQIAVALDTATLYYYCTAHSGMGGTANTINETVISNNGYWIDTTSNSCTITLPSSAEKGDQIVLIDYLRTWGTNKIIINSNGLNYQGNADTYTVEYTTSGQSINIVYSGATKGWIPLEDDVTALEPVAPPTQKAIFAFGYTGSSYVSLKNLVGSNGVIAADITGVGTIRRNLGAATFGGDKAIFAYGYTGSNTNLSNLVSNTGVVAADVSGVGTAREALSATGYGDDKAIFGFGYISGVTAITNLVSNSGVVSADVSGVGTASNQRAAVRYGSTGQALFGYGTDYINLTNKVSNLGVVASDTSGVGTARASLAATSYGSGLAIFAYGDNGSLLSMSNKVNNVGAVAADVSGVGTARRQIGYSNYGGDKGIFGYGNDGSRVSMSNLVSNSGVIAADVSGVGTARDSLAAAGYSYSA